MPGYRLEPSREQEAVLLRHCADARYVWNLCVEQESWWRPGRGRMPGFAERCRQLTGARADNPWLAEGSVIVQQQAIRDHDQAMANFFAGTHRRPRWRKAGRDEGFRIVHLQPGEVRRLNRRWGEVRVPKAGWVRFRWSRAVPDGWSAAWRTRPPEGSKEYHPRSPASAARRAGTSQRKAARAKPSSAAWPAPTPKTLT